MYLTIQQRVKQEIELLYSRLPHVACTGCGTCCVSPTCTLVEFIYFLDYCTRNFTSEQMSRVLTTAPSLHCDYEGNTVCLYLEEGRCMVHPGRTGACRLFGIPSVDRMNIPGLVTCRQKNYAETEGFTSEEVKKWLRDLVCLNRTLFPMGEAPYFLTGLTIECWCDVYFNDSWTQPFFKKLHDILHRHISLPMDVSYTQRTGIFEKVAAIDRFFAIIDSGDAAAMVPLLLTIRDDFPYTGTWYHDEAQCFIDELENVAVGEGAVAAAGRS